MRTFEVLLSAVAGEADATTLVGHLAEASNGHTGFRFTDDYRKLAGRPVLGQRFEDDLSQTYVGVSGRLPPWFANLIPEGPVRGVMERSLEVPAGDDLALGAGLDKGPGE